MKKLLIRFFDLDQEDFQKTLRLQGAIFLYITALLITKPTVTSLFLGELTSDALPFGYVLTAIFAVVGSVFYNKIADRIDLKVIVERTIIVSIASLITFGLLLKFNAVIGVLYYIMYVWVAIFGLLIASQFWTMANLAFNVREAKRAFGFIGAGAIGGAIFGGYITSLLANYISTENFLFIAAGILIASIPITRIIWLNDVEQLNEYQLSRRQVKISGSSFKLIRFSPLLSQISIVMGFSVMIAKLVDYQYGDYASRLITDQDELTSFFGFWLSTLSVISLLIQLFITKRVVGTYGVGTSLLWLPTGILLGSILLLIHPALWVVVFIKIIDGSLKQSINKSATELLAIPVPLEIKKKTKPFIDVVIDSIATGAAGLLLIFFINALDIPSQAVSLIIIIFIAFWLFFIIRVKKEYIIHFRKLIEHRGKQTTKSTREEIPVEGIIKSIRRVLREGDEPQIIFMLRKTLDSPDERFLNEFENLLRHDSHQVLQLSVENLYYLKSSAALIEQISALLNIKDTEVNAAVFKYLLKHAREHTLKQSDYYSTHPDSSVRYGWLLGISQEFRNHTALQEKYRLTQTIASLRKRLESAEDLTGKTAIIRAIGYGKIQSHYDFLWKYLEPEHLELTPVAILSCAHTLDPQFIPVLVRKLPKKHLRKAAVEALGLFGDPIIPKLLDYIKQESLEVEQSVHIPAVLERFESSVAIDGLLFLARKTEHAIKMEALTALKRIHERNPRLHIKDRELIDSIIDECSLYEITLQAMHAISSSDGMATNQSPRVRKARETLIHLLQARLDRPLERIFNFLGLKYPPDDIDPVYKTLKDGRYEDQLHAIEFLDNILDPRLKRELIPIVETVIVDSPFQERMKSMKSELGTDLQCYAALLKRPDYKLKIAVIRLIEETRDSKYLSLLNEYSLHPNKKVRAAVESAIGALEVTISL